MGDRHKTVTSPHGGYTDHGPPRAQFVDVAGNPVFPGFRWWAVRGSNPRPSRCKRDALPTELTARHAGKRAIAGFLRWVNHRVDGTGQKR
jgi:hypothetical protein